jgi:serine/threonine-protein kinase RsbW
VFARPQVGKTLVVGAQRATPDLSLRVRAVPENVPVIRHALGAIASTRGADPDVRGAIALAVTEAASNVVLHAYPDGRPGVLEVEVEAAGERGHLAITVRDDGTGIVRDAPSPGLGAGLPLISAVADRVDVRSGTPGTELCMSFTLAA